MATLIKKIGTESIVFEEINHQETTLTDLIVAGVIYNIIVISMAALVSANVVVLNGNIVTIMLTVLGFAAVCTGVVLVFSAAADLFAQHYVPYYNVYIRGRCHGNAVITFPKVDDETDQKEICKAAARLEPIAKEYDEHAKKLEQFAQRCK